MPMSSTPNLRIGLLSWDYGRPKGGMGRALQQVAAALRHDEISVHTLTPYPDETDERSLLRFTHQFGGQILFSLLLPFILAATIRNQRLQGLLLPVGPGGVLLFRRPSVPAIAIVYHTYLQQYQLVPGQSWKRIFCPWERRTLSLCHQIICYSEDTKTALMNEYGIDQGKITVLPFPVETPEPSSISRDPYLCICVARLEARKGVDVVLHAWPTIVQQIPHARLIVVGDGVQRTMVDRLIASTTGVERRSGISQYEMQDLLARASVAFCPAYLEGFGCACAEAMAAGCMVIASDADGLRQLITQGKNGILVPAGDSESLAAATIGLLAHVDASRTMADLARESMRSMHDPVAANSALCAAVRSGFAR